MPEANILIIGGGSAGLSMAATLKQYGLESVILDSASKIGDVWRNHYDRLKLHTVRSLSHSVGMKIDPQLPRYISKDDLADYLTNYAEHFNLDIHLNCNVTRVTRANQRYKVATETSDIWFAEHLIIATGGSRQRLMPEWKGMDDFQGQLIHTSDYKNGKAFAGKRVLVIGCGNSGAEICVDCVEGGATYTANSIRTFPMVVRRDMLGIPLHNWVLAVSALPVRAQIFIFDILVKITVGDLSAYGFQAPERNMFKDGVTPMIDVGYIDLLKQRRIHIKPDIDCLTETGIQFVDGTTEDYDVIIAATGYQTGLNEIIDLPGVCDGDGRVVASNNADAPYRNLWFIGFAPAPTGTLMGARAQAEDIACQIVAHYRRVSSATGVCT